MPRNPVRFCAEVPLLACGFQGNERIDGVETQRWGAEFGLGELGMSAVAWYDPQLQYPVRVELQGSGVRQLSNIEVERVPSALFSIPFNVRRVERVKGVEIDYFSEWR